MGRMAKRISIGRAAALGAALAFFGLLTGCTAAAEPENHEQPNAAAEQEDVSAGANKSGFPAAVTFDYQLGGAYDLPAGVTVLARDRSDAPASGVFSICYVNGFQTQPGELTVWPQEALLYADGAPVIDADWPDEVLLDTSTQAKRQAILSIVTPWIETCAADGYQAVEFDNLDSFTRSDEALTLQDNLALAAEFAEVAHEAGLLVGQKNSAEITTELREQAKFDFAVAEECAAYEECDAYTEAYGEAVIDIEYTDTLPRSFAEMCADPASPSSMILRDRELTTPNSPDYVFESCAA